MKKICVVTSTRADYGLLYWLIKGLDEDNSFNLQLVVTGMHLEDDFGHTIDVISKEFPIEYQFSLELHDDSSKGIANSMAKAQIGFTKAYSQLQPDLIILLGDRYEIFCAASSALISQIPVAHLHGGELTYGAYDDAFRHSITKMSHLHFCATDIYKNRIIQMGENPKYIYNVGGLGIENINKLHLLSHKEFENSIDFKLNHKNFLITYHPETLAKKSSKEQFQEILDVFELLEDTNIIFTYANSDTDGKIINKMIENYVKNHSNCIAFKSMGQLRYLSCLQFVDGVIGNTSSGILEVPSFKKATINIGNRQKGRTQATSIINTQAEKKSIKKAIDKLYSNEFQSQLKETINPYDNGHSSQKIISILKEIDFKPLTHKIFFDLKEMI
ncbi:MAG TPA: UDP-N-acetylglucosamine 2-epimerase (hydrolyzing) [Arcobacter sp.]|nr:UDP-N-acetylglucosamine 2-epimerase (hydrolyzing) [Arcobacter sp.]